MSWDLHRGAAHKLMLEHPSHASTLTSSPGQTGLGQVPGVSSPTQFTFQVPLLWPATLPHSCPGEGPSASETNACSLSLLPARWQQQGGGRAQPEKASIYKLPAPSSTLEAGAWALAPTLVWVTQWASLHWAKQGRRAQGFPCPGSAGPGQVRCRADRSRKPDQVLPRCEITQLPYQRWRGFPTFQMD